MLQIIETHKIQFLILKDMTMQKFPCYAVDICYGKDFEDGLPTETKFFQSEDLKAAISGYFSF